MLNNYPVIFEQDYLFPRDLYPDGQAQILFKVWIVGFCYSSVSAVAAAKVIAVVRSIRPSPAANSKSETA